jgi:hypothetical protein
VNRFVLSVSAPGDGEGRSEVQAGGEDRALRQLDAP